MSINIDMGTRMVTIPRPHEDVLSRVGELEQARDQVFPDQQRTAQVLAGGREAVQALTQGKDAGEHRDLPIANYMKDALEALASRISKVPELRVDPPQRGRKSDQSDRALKAAEKRARIARHYDDAGALPMSLPQLARWVPGAAYTVVTIDPTKQGGFPYPKRTFHYPLDTAISQWTPLTDPVDCAIVSRVPIRELARMYPEHKTAIMKVKADSLGAVDLNDPSFKRGLKFVRYYDLDGTWYLLPERGLLLDFVKNPLESGPAFVPFVKFNYSRLRGEFDDLIGLMISMARLNILAEIAVKDNVFAPTNLIGGPPISGEYKKGRAVNIFDANTRIEIPQRGVQFEAWNQLDRLERQLSIEATVPQQDRGESPMSFVTGRGLQRLDARVERQVAEYQTVFSHGLQRMDAKTLEYDEKSWPDIAKPMQGTWRGAQFVENYTPSTHINGGYRTVREYGVMAGVEEATKMNGLAIMDSARWVSKRWVRSQIDGLGNATELEEQIRFEAAEQAFLELLGAHATNPESPEHMRALQAVVDMLPAGDLREVAEKWLTEGGPELDPMEEELVGPLGGAGAGGPPPDPTAVLARLTAGGEARGGVQTLGRLQ